MSMLVLADRTRHIAPFYAMEIVKEAAQLAADGRSIIHLSIGEPDFTAPPAVQQAAARAIEAGATGYTPALGTEALRAAISTHYQRAYNVEIPPRRVVVTAGASGALLLALAALAECGSEILLPDPSYPCNRHFVAMLNARARLIPCGAEARFQLTPQLIDTHWGPATRGVLLASPSNPTGTSISMDALAGIISVVERRDGFVIVDEIYQGLSYDHPPRTALSLDGRVVVINSFSKYFNMTGWRLGWLVVPEPWVSVIEKLAQNFFICASTVAQHAALACFEPASIAIYEQRRVEFQRRRDALIPALQDLGFGIPAVPDGAFYIYADISRFSADSADFARRLLHQAGVCVVPGLDFGAATAERYIRISYATSMQNIEEAIIRIKKFLGRGA